MHPPAGRRRHGGDELEPPAFVEERPDLFEADVIVDRRYGEPGARDPDAATTLRGEVACVVKVSTLEHALHSGAFGGPAPDAMMALARVSATLHDDEGDVAVEGLGRVPDPTGDLPDPAFRFDGRPARGIAADRHRHDRVAALVQTRHQRHRYRYDHDPGSSNVLLPRAKLSMRIAPGSDPDVELEALVRHLQARAPWGAAVEVERGKLAPGFRCAIDGPAWAAACSALERSFGRLAV